MRHHSLHDWLRFGALLAGLAGLPGLTLADTAVPPAAPPAGEAGTTIPLKGMPASRDLMTFRGESSSAAWPVFLNRAEAAQITTLQLGLLNTVSALPERSSLRVSVNGRPLANLAVNSPDRVTAIPVRVPPGLLVPGFNAVQVDVAMTHRVDCSVKATYELWTLLDPAQTGFVLPRSAAGASRSLDDLAGEPLGPDGTNRIHVRLPDGATPMALGQAADLVAALTARAHLLRPVVDVGPEPGTGTGFDLAFGPAPDGRTVGQEADLTLVRNDASGRLTVAMPAADADQVDGTLQALRRAADRSPEGSSQGLQALALQTGAVLEDDHTISFADLGLQSVSFTGRHLSRTLGVTLPRDFYPGNYGMVRLFIDGDHAQGLLPGSTIVFRVNGALVSSLPLGPGAPDKLDHALVELPLKFFRPGYNAVEIDANTQSQADERCTVGTAPPEVRLTLADTSEVTLPHLARMETVPQIASLLQNDGTSATAHDIYLTSPDRLSAGVGLTVAANAAARNGAARTRFNLDQPVASDQPGIVVGPYQNLPDLLVRSFHRDFTAASQTDAAATTVADEPGAARKAEQAAGRSASWLQTAAQTAAYWLRTNGFFFSGLQAAQAPLAVGENSLLVADVAMRDDTRKIAGVDLPRFSDRQDRWLVVTGASAGSMADASSALVANGRWRDLAGEAVSYDPEKNVLQRREPTDVSYVVPKTLAVGDVQPILGGLVSSNIVVSLVVLLVLVSLLGLSTHVMLSIAGKRPR